MWQPSPRRRWQRKNKWEEDPPAIKQEGHELLHLQTNSVITRHKVTSVPVTPSIISQVHALARLDGMPPGLKIISRTNQILFDSAWTAGVDYDPQNQKNFAENGLDASYNKVDPNKLDEINHDKAIPSKVECS